MRHSRLASARLGCSNCGAVADESICESGVGCGEIPRSAGPATCTTGSRHRRAAPRAARAAGSACAARRAPTTCLRITHPLLVEPAEWDYAANDAAGITPDTVLSGSREEVSWRCVTHGSYRMAILLRAHDGQRCRVCARLAAEQKRRETLRARRRERYAEGKMASETGT